MLGAVSKRLRPTYAPSDANMCLRRWDHPWLAVRDSPRDGSRLRKRYRMSMLASESAPPSRQRGKHVGIATFKKVCCATVCGEDLQKRRTGVTSFRSLAFESVRVDAMHQIALVLMKLIIRSILNRRSVADRVCSEMTAPIAEKHRRCNRLRWVSRILGLLSKGVRCDTHDLHWTVGVLSNVGAGEY